MAAPARPRVAALALAATAIHVAAAVTIRNDVPRVDVDGKIIDAHSGNIIWHAPSQLYYMVGEHYGNSTGFGPSPPQMFPKIVTYTSPDLAAWTFRGFALSNYTGELFGTFFVPWVAFNPVTNLFVLWMNAYLGGCCSGGFGVATSADGVNYTVVTLNGTSRYPIVDGNALFVDDDGSAYVLYTSEDPAPGQNHMVSFEKLDATWTVNDPASNAGLLFPENYVEGAIMWKRAGRYYVSFGSCCCFCRGGSGVVVYSATALTGPWTRQPYDLNCEGNDTPICGAYGDRTNGKLTVAAQGIGLSIIPLAAGGSALVWHGERWLSAAGANPTCDDECAPCVEPPTYIKGEGFSYWTPLAFDDATGAMLPFAPFVDSFELDAVGAPAAAPPAAAAVLAAVCV